MENISIIVPIYNERKNVENLIKTIKKLDGIYEVIFVDSSNDEYSKQIIEKNNFTYISSPKGRGIQMNTGYKKSTGDILFFLHCDSVIYSDCLINISNAITSGVEFGCLFIEFDDKRLLMKICSFMSRFRAIHRKIAFGDQGMFFTRKIFEQLNGFSNIPIMEDYDISIRAKKITNLVQINSKIITSSRKYYSGYGVFNKGWLSFIGILKNMLDMQIYQYKFRKGISTEKINKSYYNKV